MAHILLYLALCVVIWTLLRRTYVRFKPGLNAHPGPPLAAWTRLWRLIDVTKGRAHLTAIAIHRRYGKIVRVGPNVVSISDPAMISEIYNTQGTFNKSAFYPIQSVTWKKSVHLNVFSTRDEREHHHMKRKVASAYTLDALLYMEDSMNECGNLLVSQLRHRAGLQTCVDLGAWLHYYVADMVGTVTFNERFGFLESGSDVDGMIAGSEFMMYYFSCCGMTDTSQAVARKPNAPIPYSRGSPCLSTLPTISDRHKQLEAANHGLAFTLRALHRNTTVSDQGLVCMKQNKSGEHMLSRWATVNSQSPDKMSVADLVVALSTNVFAAIDTTAISLRAVLYFLIKNPAKMRKLVYEIDNAYRNGEISDITSDRESRNHLPYLNAAIKEALRLHPATGLMLERHVPDGGAVLCGKYIPGGTIVGINPWVVQRDPNVFPNPDDFEPERWLKTSSNDQQLAKMERAMLVFGAGSRICMGRNLSMIEMRKIVPRLLRVFEFSFQDDGEWTVSGGWFTPQKMPACLIALRTSS